MTIKKSATLRNAQLDQITTTLSTSPILRIYTGSQPASVATAVSGTLLAELTCSTAFAGSASSGVLTANDITQDSAANATGAAGWWRLFEDDGTTAHMDGDCGASGSGADMELNTTSIVADGPVQVTSFTLTAGGA